MAKILSFLKSFCFVILFVHTSLISNATVTLPRLVSNGMVLQRGVPIPVWGWAAPGENIEVSFNGDNFQTTANSLGKWGVSIPAMAAGGPHVMSISGTNTIVVSDILIGDVYLCSGQSNMALNFNSTDLYENANRNNPNFYAAEIAASSNPSIRQFKVNSGFNAEVQNDALSNKGWLAASPTNLPEFSVVAYFFAKEMHAKYNIPIGILNSSFGGTIIEAWISKEGFANFPSAVPENNTSVDNTYPNVIHNAMIAPLVNSRLKGMLWYQGESNNREAVKYRRLLPALIADVRTKFNLPNLPFIIVQLANYDDVQEPQQYSSIAEIREAQASALSISKTAMVVAHETNSAVTIHPKEKKPIGERLAKAAQRLIFNESVIAQSPAYYSNKIVGNKIIVTFNNFYSSTLVMQGGALNQFAIAGADMVFVKADATITATNKVTVSAASVPEPKFVRYAWADNPGNANLYNAEGLPAASFRTDSLYVGGSYAKQSFIPGNLVVVRYGDGINLPAAGRTVGIFLDEYSTDGLKRPVSRELPSGIASIDDPNGINNTIVGLHSSGNEGLISLSENKKYLVIAGHNAILQQEVGAAGSKTIGVLTADGAINTGTTIGIGYPRAVAISDDISKIYYVASARGIGYVPYQSSKASVVLSAGNNIHRSLTIAGGLLYASAAESGNALLGRIGSSNLPTSGSYTIDNLPGVSNSEIARQFVFLSSAGNGINNLLYVATENNRISKYALESGAWIAKGFVTVASIRALTGKIVNNEAQIFATTLKSGFISTLVKVVDANPVSSTITGKPVVVIATAEANSYFRGVAFVPENSDYTMLPVQLTGFKGNGTSNGVKLSWQTTSENNSSHFEVLRSTDGKQFDRIATINAAGNSNTPLQYNYSDATAIKGTNYYKLKIKDNNSSSGESTVIVVKSRLEQESFKIYSSGSGSIAIEFYSLADVKAELIFSDISGHIVDREKLAIKKGRNIFFKSASHWAPGLFVGKLVADQKSFHHKILINHP